MFGEKTEVPLSAIVTQRNAQLCEGIPESFMQTPRPVKPPTTNTTTQQSHGPAGAAIQIWKTVSNGGCATQHAGKVEIQSACHSAFHFGNTHKALSMGFGANQMGFGTKG